MQNQEKQIEEMAKVLCEDCARDTSPCVLTKTSRMCESVKEQAEALYTAGYRKQSEGEWITKHRHRGGFRTVTVVDSFGEKHTGMVDERWECDDLYCSVCGKIAHDAFLNYCANCGAKMKGGAE